MKIYIATSILLLTSAGLAQPDLSSKVFLSADHPIYGLQRAIENFGRIFQFMDEAKARYALDLAERRLAEAQDLMQKSPAGPVVESGRAARVAQLTYEYEQELSTVRSFGLQISQLAKQRDVQQLIEAATSIYVTVLKEVRTRLPADVQTVIDGAIANSTEVRTVAQQRISEIQLQTGISEEACRLQGGVYTSCPPNACQRQQRPGVFCLTVCGEPECIVDTAQQTANVSGI